MIAQVDPKPCVVCGKEFRNNYMTKRKFCNLDCAIVQRKRIARAKRGRQMSKCLRLKILRRDNWTCQMCGVDTREKGQEIDHITPIAEGGDPKAPDNLRVLCGPCHWSHTQAWFKGYIKRKNAKILTPETSR